MRPWLFLSAALLLAFDAPAAPWTPLEPGLELGVFTAAPPGGDPDPRVFVVRVDPARRPLTLLTAAARGEAPATTRTWAARAHLAVAINASLYQKDERSSTALMIGPGFVNNPTLSKDNTVLAFGRRGTTGPAAQIIDRTCQPFEALRREYRTLVQGIRMLDCAGANVWRPQARRYSHAVLGTDAAGRVLLIHAAAEWTSHDFVEALKGLGLGLTRLQYAEGSYPAQLYVRAGGIEVERRGRWHGLGLAHPVPNVIGVPALTAQPPPAPR